MNVISITFIISVLVSYVNASEGDNCISDIPTNNDNNDAVLIHFFNNPDRGNEGESQV